MPAKKYAHHEMDNEVAAARVTPKDIKGGDVQKAPKHTRSKKGSSEYTAHMAHDAGDE